MSGRVWSGSVHVRLVEFGLNLLSETTVMTLLLFCYFILHAKMILEYHVTIVNKNYDTAGFATVV